MIKDRHKSSNHNMYSLTNLSIRQKATVVGPMHNIQFTPFSVDVFSVHRNMHLMICHISFDWITKKDLNVLKKNLWIEIIRPAHIVFNKIPAIQTILTKTSIEQSKLNQINQFWLIIEIDDLLLSYHAMKFKHTIQTHFRI